MDNVVVVGVSSMLAWIRLHEGVGHVGVDHVLRKDRRDMLSV